MDHNKIQSSSILSAVLEPPCESQVQLPLVDMPHFPIFDDQGQFIRQKFKVYKSTTHDKTTGEILVKQLIAKNSPDVITFYATPKLHGSNLSMILAPNGWIYIYSRNCLQGVVPPDSNYPFMPEGAHFGVDQIINHVNIRALFNPIPDRDGLSKCISMEYCGQGLQQYPPTAIMNMDRFLVVIAAGYAKQPNSSSWEYLPIRNYHRIQDPDNRIFHINLGGYRKLKLRPSQNLLALKEKLRQVINSPRKNKSNEEGLARRDAILDLKVQVEDAAHAVVLEFEAQLREMVQEAGARCPFGLQMGVQGPGEGWVCWTLNHGKLMRFKARTEAFYPLGVNMFPPQIDLTLALETHAPLLAPDIRIKQALDKCVEELQEELRGDHMWIVVGHLVYDIWEEDAVLLKCSKEQVMGREAPFRQAVARLVHGFMSKSPLTQDLALPDV